MAKSTSEGGIALTTVYFFKGELPGVLGLRDTSLPLIGNCAGAFASLYGHRSKREGLMAARRYADQEGLNYTVIDFLVATAGSKRREGAEVEDIDRLEILAIDQLTRAALEAVYDLMETRAGPLGLNRGKHFRRDFDALIQLRPDLLCALLDLQKMAQVKAILFLGKVAFSERPVTLALLPHRHWKSITEAACRLDPATMLDLSSP